MRGIAEEQFRFGEFELDPARRRLSRDGVDLSLNPKAFDLLVELIRNSGKVVSKDDLLERVWPDQIVEENNLSVHVSTLRKILGDGNGAGRFIATVPGKGYSFVAPIEWPDDEIIVEQRTIERIVLEHDGSGPGQEIETGPSDQSVLAAKSINGSWLRNHRVAAATIAGIAILLLGVGGYFVRDRLARGHAFAPFVQHNVRQLTTNGKVGSAALSPDGRSFVYTVDDLGQKSLWLGYVEGGNHVLLREPSETTYRSPVFSPDGSHIYYSVRDDKDPNGALYRMPLPGGVQAKVLDGIRDFSLSPDGKRIAFGRHDDSQERDVITVADLNGGERRDVVSFSNDESYASGTISWSPDGVRLAVRTASADISQGIYITLIDISSGGVEKVPVNGVREVTKTAWLRDGNGLVITAIENSAQSSVPQYQIWHMALPGGELSLISPDRSNYGASWHNDAGVTLSLSDRTDLLLTVEHRQLANVWVAPSDDLKSARQITNGSFGKYDGLWGLDWTADGRLIYTTSDTRSQFLAQMNVDGSGQRPLSEPGKIDSVLTVSNDGKYILFHSNRAGGFDIWRTDIDGTNAKQLTFGGNGYHPAPSPDGQWVYYKNYLAGLGILCRVPIGGGDPDCLDDTETSWGSFSPDGKYFAAVYATDRPRLAVFSAETNQVLRQFELPKTGTLYMGSRWAPDSKAVAYRDRNYGYWLQPIDGGEPKRMEGLPKEKLYNFAFSKDGKQIAFVRGPEIRDAILLEAFPVQK